MNRYAIIKNGKVDNVIRADESFSKHVTCDYYIKLDDDSPVSIGYKYDGQQFEYSEAENKIIKQKKVTQEQKQGLKEILKNKDNMSNKQKMDMLIEFMEVYLGK